MGLVVCRVTRCRFWVQTGFAPGRDRWRLSTAGLHILPGNPQHRWAMPLLFCANNCKLNIHIQCPTTFPQVRMSQRRAVNFNRNSCKANGPRLGGCSRDGGGERAVAAPCSPETAGREPGALGSGYVSKSSSAALPTPLDCRQRLVEMFHFKGCNNFNVNIFPEAKLCRELMAPYELLVPSLCRAHPGLREEASVTLILLLFERELSCLLMQREHLLQALLSSSW